MAKKRPHGTGTIFRRHDRGPWHVSWWGADGKRKEKNTRTTDKAAAERILAKCIGDAALRRDGVVDPRDDRYSAADRKLLTEHVAEWQAVLTAKVTAKQVDTLLHRVKALLVAVKVERISGLSASSIQTAIGELKSNGTSLQTCQHY